MESSVPAPQSLVVTLTGYRNQENALKCKLYYMMTLPKDPSVIKNIHLTLERLVGENETERVSEITVPFDWAKAQLHVHHLKQSSRGANQSKFAHPALSCASP